MVWSIEKRSLDDHKILVILAELSKTTILYSESLLKSCWEKITFGSFRCFLAPVIREVCLAIDQTPERVSSTQLFRDKKVGTANIQVAKIVTNLADIKRLFFYASHQCVFERW